MINISLKRFAWLVHPLALLPLALLAVDTALDNLSVNFIQDITERTGIPALVLLVLSIACTPLNTVFGWKWAVALRKPLGLYAFLYVCLHLLTFTALDYGLDWGAIATEVGEKRYILVGTAAFLLLVPLALTSNKAAMRRLGKNWKRLHLLVYAIVPLAVLHYLWLSKDPRPALLFGAATGVLLLLRLPVLRRAFSALRKPGASVDRQKTDTAM
ncbi:MAG: sulfoxide reductase heme-binding subunit YedZ [Roseiflexaceae bacterium]|nr:sulfoxide reductase heme-binding subunit YedZ [Roseiflexaceae bacterium]